MRNDAWQFDRSDILCPNCRDTCYFKFVGESFGDFYIQRLWKCACCGWKHSERTSPDGQILAEPSEAPSAYIDYATSPSAKPWFIFKILPIEIALAHHPKVAELEPEILKTAYVNWLNSFEDKAKNFYLNQHVDHTEYVFDRFSQEYELGYQFSQEGFWAIKDKNLEKEWRQYKQIETLDKHDVEYDHALREMHLYVWQINKQAIGGFMEDVIELNQTYREFKKLLWSFNGVWFNQVVVNNSPELQMALRNLLYTQYLKTLHWIRVRAAMLLTSDEYRCEICWNKPFGLPQGESDLHIHHRTYKNLGNERYEDLSLLCNECHLKMHS